MTTGLLAIGAIVLAFLAGGLVIAWRQHHGRPRPRIRGGARPLSRHELEAWNLADMPSSREAHDDE